MSLTSLPVSTQDLENLQLGILRISNPSQAAAEAALINAQATTVQAYADSLLASSARASETTVGVISSFTNVTPTNAQLDFFVLTFAPPQIAVAVAHGFNQTVFLAEAIGLGFGTSDPTAIANFTGQAAFPNTVAGDVNFVNAAAAAIYGPANTPNLVSVFQGWVANWKAFYTANGLPGNPTPTANQIDTAARAAAFGDAVGVAIENNIGPLRDFADGVLIGDALFKNGEGPNILGVPNATAATIIASNPSLEGGASAIFNLTIGVDNFSTTQVGAIFNAVPASNPPLGNTNTLNQGDNLQDSQGDGLLNLTQVHSIINPEIAPGVTMNGISDVMILNLAGNTGGFFGNITGLLNATLLAGSNAGEELGTAAFGLNTPLQNVELQASENFTAWIATAAFGGGDTVTLNLNVAGGYDGEVEFNSTGGNQYETINVVTGGGASNVLTLDVNVGVPFINVSGGQHLDIDGPALNLGPLDTFDASATTGGVHASFNGSGDATVIGGSGADFFDFPSTAGNINVQGNAGNDVFFFRSADGGTATFGAGDSADGGPGTDLLRIQADHGEILQGGSITTIETVQHVTNGAASGNFTANMSNLGSATTLDLAGNYNNNNDVTVNNLTNVQTVLYSGDDLDDLTLNHAGVLGNDNLTMAQVAPGGTLAINVLHTFDPLNLITTGNASLNLIFDVLDVNGNVQITGGTPLQFGSEGAQYAFDGGIIDATGDTGGVTTWLSPTGTQTFFGGSGNDFVGMEDNNGNDLADFSTGGADTVQFFQANQVSTQLLNANNYNHVVAFSTNDTINIDLPFLNLTDPPLNTTNNLTPTDPALFLQYQTGDLVNAGGTAFDFVKVTTAVNGAGLTAQQGFAASIGGGAIGVNAGSSSVLYGYFDAFHSLMVLGAVDTGVVAIDNGDHFDVIATIGMTQATYDAFNVNQLHFV